MPMENELEPVKPGETVTTILVVDDEPENLSLLTHLLRPFYHVRAANSGENALRAAVSEPRPDLVLLDVMMPEMDGYEVLVRLRKDPATADIPVVFVTALTDADAEERGLALGAADYIAKPIKPPVVLARVRTQIENKRARDWMTNKNQILEAEVARRLEVQQELHRQLVQTEKLASIGLLAAGVAHEINNPVGFVSSNLTTMRGYVSSLLDITVAVDGALRHAPETETFRQKLGELRDKINDADMDYIRNDLPSLLTESADGLERIKKIVVDLKNFAHADSEQRQLADINAGLKSTLNLVWNEIKYKATVSTDYGTLPPVCCQPGKINQVLMNILVNAAQAIDKSGTIGIKTWHADGVVCIAISDTGCGIPQSAMDRIFEPFYTTKPVGKGTGLGLSLAYGILREHGGRIDVASRIGEGTTFTVVLPVGGLAAAPASPSVD
jgi:two-component system NtrC family sensor kinase